MSNSYKRVLAIDYGTVRVGIAISDPLRIIARGLETIDRKGDDEGVILRIKELVQEYQVDTIILGLPLRTDDLPGERELATRAFAAQIEDMLGITPILQDERYTTIIAEEIMSKTAVKEKRRKAIVDQIAAEIILQDYLNVNSH